MQRFYERHPLVEFEAIQLSISPGKYGLCIKEWKGIENLFGPGVSAIGNNVEGEFECLSIAIKKPSNNCNTTWYTALPGDWIIRNVETEELFCCSEKDFSNNYEAIGEDNGK